VRGERQLFPANGRVVILDHRLKSAGLKCGNVRAVFNGLAACEQIRPDARRRR
jgi:hypothetical protein